jgi:hypothetical protein
MPEARIIEVLIRQWKWGNGKGRRVTGNIKFRGKL